MRATPTFHVIAVSKAVKRSQATTGLGDPLTRWPATASPSHEAPPVPSRRLDCHVAACENRSVLSLRRAPLLLVVLVGLGASALFGAGVSAAAEPTTDPTACLDGGWQAEQTDQGGQFRSQHDCLGYVRHGGVLYNPVVGDVVAFCDTSPFLAVEMFFFPTGFHPNTTLTDTISGAYKYFGGATTSVIAPDGKGDWSTQLTLVPTMHVVTFTLTDPYGVTATTSFNFADSPLVGDCGPGAFPAT